MTEKRAPYTTANKPAATLAEITANVAALQANLNAQGYGPRDLKTELAAAQQRIAELEAENKSLIRQVAEHSTAEHALRTQTQVYWLEINELQQALLGLVTGLAALPDNWIVVAEHYRIAPQLAQARDRLARAGLLPSSPLPLGGPRPELVEGAGGEG